MRHYKTLTIASITLTSLPFLLLLANIDPSLSTTSPDIFWSNVALTVGSICGFVGTVWCVWGLILGTRFIFRYSTRDMLWMNSVHKTLGIYGVLFIVLHPILKTVAYSQGVLYALIPSLRSEFETHVTYGRFALLAFVIIWITSAVVRGKIRYRPWLYIHYLSYPMLLLSFLHAREIGTTLLAYPLLQLLWNILFIAVVLVSILRIAIAGGFLQPTYHVKTVSHVGPTTVLTLTPLNNKWIKPLPGQFAYLQLNRFGEAHPFSVIEYNPDDGSLVFGIKAFGKFSKKCASLTIDDVVFLDGPYGVFTQEGHSSAPKVLIAGGIGITPFISLVKHHGNEHTYLLNCNRTASEAIYRDSLRQSMGKNYWDVFSNETTLSDPQSIQGTLTQEVLANTIPLSVWKSANIFFCGNPKFYATVKEMLLSMGVPEQQIFFEQFSL